MTKVSVNITTTSNRLDLCSQTVWSLMNQVAMPDKIVIWVSAEKYLIDEGIKEIPGWARDLNKVNDIIVFKWTKNIGPYRKLIPALKIAGDEDVIVYADDDAVYKRNWLKILLDKYKENNGSKIVASRVRKVKKNAFNKYVSYMLWPIIFKEAELKRDYVLTGLGGVVINKMHIKRVFLEDEQFINLCPKTDDLWFSEIAIRSSSITVTCPNAMKEICPIEHNLGLSESNGLVKGSLSHRVMNKLKVILLGQLGVSICNNDYSFKNLKKYFAEKNQGIL